MYNPNNRYFLFGLLGIAIFLIFIVIIIIILLFRGDTLTNTTRTTPQVTTAPLPRGATPETPRITKISPIRNEKNVNQNNSIFITFENAIPQGIIISLSPSLSGALRQTEEAKTVEFIPSTAFQAQTLYRATLTIQGEQFVTPDNTLDTSYSWSFTTGEQQGESGFSQEAIQQQIKQKQAAEKAYGDRKARLPFIVHLPYYSTNFKVEIMATSDTVTVTTFGNTQSEIEAYRQEARDWLIQNGAVFDRFTLRYENTPR